MKLAVPCLVLASACVTLDEPVVDTEATEQALNGDTWANSDLLAPAPGTMRGAAIGSQHQIYIVGSNASRSAWVFRTSMDGGRTYSNGPSYQLGPDDAVADAIAVDHIGRIVVAGYAVDLSNNWRVVTRLSTDGGVTFTTVDSVTFPPDAIHGVSSIVVDSNGQFTVAINGIEAPSILRRSTPGALTWTTIPNPTPFVKARGLCTTSAGLVATGISTLTSKLVTYRYANGAWALLDAPNFVGSGWACTEVNGALYASGSKCLVRRSANGGASWTTVDPGVDGCSTRALGPGRNNRVYLVASRDAAWTVRRTSNGTTWVDSDIALDDNGSTDAHGFAFDRTLGNMTVVGDNGGTNVRRLL